jgi:hypothetical protein
LSVLSDGAVHATATGRSDKAVVNRKKIDGRRRHVDGRVCGVKFPTTLKRFSGLKAIGG